MAGYAGFEGKIVAVTGGASGIGEATVRRFASAGAKVVIADFNAERGEALARETGSIFHSVDVTDPDQIAGLFDRVARECGGLDILINNAGIGGGGAATPELDPLDWRRVMAVNIDAVYHGCRFAIPLMRAHGGGVIVNTASISGLAADHGFTAYNASKGAVINYTRALALDHAKDGIRVNAICPGLIETALTERLQGTPKLLEQWHRAIPLGRAGRADEIAAVIAFLASEEASYVTGSIIVADGGMTASTGQPNLPDFFAGAQA